MKKEDMIEKFGSGWNEFIEKIYSIQDQLAFCTGISSMERKNGMLAVLFNRTDLTTPEQEFILNSIEYRIERLTARLCEECGQYGTRRPELPEVKTLCTKCYAFAYSEIHPVPSWVANQKPQTIE